MPRERIVAERIELSTGSVSLAYSARMARKLPLNDFRAVRTVLEASDFSDAPGPRVRSAKDLVDKGTWEHIQTLPETVAIFTSNDHGGYLDLVTIFGDTG